MPTSSLIQWGIVNKFDPDLSADRTPPGIGRISILNLIKYSEFNYL